MCTKMFMYSVSHVFSCFVICFYDIVPISEVLNLMKHKIAVGPKVILPNTILDLYLSNERCWVRVRGPCPTMHEIKGMVP